ncbi:hypothetical protein BDV09DRAFT_200902 [Aspergillus tetrazonus]
MNYAASKSSALGLGPAKVLQQSSTGFDMSLAQAWNAFTNGGTLIVAGSNVRGDPVALPRLMRDEQIELTVATPSEYMLMATYGADYLRNCPLLAAYFPTEISCATTFNGIPISSLGTSTASPTGSVGFPLPNTSVYIVDSQTHDILPVGFAGEICIGGAGLALGYLDP